MNFIASKGQLRASFFRWALFCVPAVALLGFLGGQVGTVDSLWFEGLAKPDIYPPGAAFGIAWSILYIMIGLAAALVASAWGARGRGLALGLFLVHFALNVAWHGVFFAGENVMGGLYLLAAIIVTLLAVMAAYWRVRKLAAVLLIPYLAWLCFASFLNYQIHVLNPDGGNSILLEPTQRFEI